MKTELEKAYENLLQKCEIKDNIEAIYSFRKTLSEENHTSFVNIVRNKVQEEALQAVLNSKHRNCIIAIATGAGKSKIGVDLFKNFSERYEEKSLLVVPTIKLRDDNWAEEFQKWSADYNSVEKICYKSCTKYTNKVYPLIVLDEGHNLTQKSSEILKHNQYAKCLYLSATLPENNLKRQMLKNKSFNVVYQLSLEECIKLGFVADYSINVIKVPLETRKLEYKLTVNKTLENCSEKRAYEIWTNRVKAVLDNPYSKSYAKKNILMQRLQFIYNLKSKFKALQFIKSNVISEKIRTLYFCGSIAQAELLSDYHYHSKSTDKHYKAFKEKKINHLTSVSSLNEGHTFPDLHTVVISQVQSSEKDLVQRIGRALRKNKGTVYILISEGTQDEKWLENALTFFDKSKIEYFDYQTFKNSYTYDLCDTN